MIRPDDHPWFEDPPLPSHPDYLKLMAFLDQQDVEANEDMEVYVERITGQDMHTMMHAAFHEAAMVATVFTSAVGGEAAPPVFITGASAWLTGFSAGLRKVRGITLPEGEVEPTYDEMEWMAFQKIDKESLTAVATGRAFSMAAKVVDDETISNAPEAVQYLSIVASLWLDGLITGLSFDSFTVEGGN
jgi:hypothetical protein